MRRILFAIAATTAAALTAVGAASAGREQQTFDCAGLGTITFTVTTTTNDHSVAWGVGTISGGTHLIPVGFSGYAYDVTTHTALSGFGFSQDKGNGNAMHNQSTISCTQSTPAGTAGELGIPSSVANPGDQIEFRFTAQVVYKG